MMLSCRMLSSLLCCMTNVYWEVERHGASVICGGQGLQNPLDFVMLQLLVMLRAKYTTIADLYLTFSCDIIRIRKPVDFWV